jgi:hypothetical protein
MKFKNFIVILFISLVTVGFFWQFFFKGLLPVHVNLFPTWFFPWRDGGFKGFSPWVQRKEFIVADALRQVIPWKAIGLELFKQGKFPLWNPYEFAGNPLLGNLQSSLLYPLNILFFWFSLPIAWSFYIVSQTFFCLIFSYLFFRSLKLGILPSLFGAIFFSLSGFMIVSLEWGTIGHTVLWLPFILWGINQYFQLYRLRYLLCILFGLVFSFFAGQVFYFLLILIIVVPYYLFSLSKSKDPKLSIKLVWIPILGFFLLSAVQLIPTAELYSLSSRRLSTTNNQTLEQFYLPTTNWLTLITPDYFGNPASFNFWGKEYGELMIFMGNSALLLFIYGLLFSRSRIAKFYRCLLVLSLLMMIKNPIIQFVHQFNLPLLSSSAPSRATVIFSWAVTVLAVLGLQEIIIKKKSDRHLLTAAAIHLLLLLIAWGWTLNRSFFPESKAISIAQRNLIPATAIIFSSLIILWLYQRYKKNVLLGILIGISLIEPFYLAFKYLPFGETKYFFPSHPVISMLQQENRCDRFYGNWGAEVATNLPSFYGLRYPAGYDSLNILNYNQLAHAANNGGQLKTNLPRSDVFIPRENNDYKRRLLGIAGVRIILDKQEDFGVNPQKDLEISSSDRYFWQQGAWKAYYNPDYLPRPALFDHYRTITDSSQAVADFFNPDFDYKKELILSDKTDFPNLSLADKGQAFITDCQADEVTIATHNPGNNLLFLSDAYYPGWKAYVDHQPAKIWRADYAFRAVYLAAGDHEVRFIYKPASFYWGMGLTLVGFACLVFYIIKKKNQL